MTFGVKRVTCSLALVGGLSAPSALAQAMNLTAHSDLEEVHVWGRQTGQSGASRTMPTSLVTPQDLASVNLATTEDVVRHEPSVIVRRRFIGDPNGTLGIRGSNMFQTPRSMVFADGVPLHYFLQSRWAGAPRWTMVSASEVASAEVLYGPFSAEYSGNAMGGVILIETAIPQKREFHLDMASFSQEFTAYGFDERLNGYKTFLSYGDKLGNLSLYFSYNRLENESHPQSFYHGAASVGRNAIAVAGAILGEDELGETQIWFGDAGVTDTATDNYKFKTGYEFGNWSALFNLAHEDRRSETSSPNTYLRDALGDPVWQGEARQADRTFSVPDSTFKLSAADRQSLSLGLRVRGELSDSLTLETNINRFAILEDEERSSRTHPQASGYTLAGEVIDYDDTGWHTAEIKLTVADLWQGMELITGARHETYELNTWVYESDNYLAGSKIAAVDGSGGETAISAVFAQSNWAFSESWSASLGGRYESWASRNGYFADDGELALVDVPSRSLDRFSPKLSLGYQPADKWTLRYSVARAYRFPIIEELFSQYRAFSSVSEANPDLAPEKGLHHNLMIERALGHGHARINFFQEAVQNVIEAQSTVLPGGSSLRTFVPIDKVDTRGVELIANLYGVLQDDLDLRFNLAWTQAEIVENRVDREIEGNDFPRMPRWRANLLATWHPTDRWDIGGSIQYASNSYGTLTNSDTNTEVFGAQDAYLRLGVKSGYALNDHLQLSLGVDNLTDEVSYVYHPWPGRTIHLNLSYEL